MLNSVCEKSPCPEGMECVEDLREDEYTCVCPEGKKGKCSGENGCTPPAHTEVLPSNAPLPPPQTATP